MSVAIRTVAMEIATCMTLRVGVSLILLPRLLTYFILDDALLRNLDLN